MNENFRELLAFGLKEAKACIFAGSFFILLFASSNLPLGGLTRYDFLFIISVLIQILLVVSKLETIDELKAICVFHIVGLALEIFKTHPAIGSWTYPGPGYLKVFNVPLYSGFMYAAIASYMIQAWRLLKLRVTDYPPFALALTISLAIYLNFFTHHFFYDLRWFLIVATLWVFRKTRVYYTPLNHERHMPLIVSFILIGFFIWIAENMGTLLGAWRYPHQMGAWSNVHLGKWNSWSLLVIMSFIIVANLKHLKSSVSLAKPVEVNE